MARLHRDLKTILLAIVARLRNEIEWCNESTCYFTLNPRAKPSNTGDRWITVSPGGGKFDESQFAGGGRVLLTADSRFTVTIHSPVALDEVGHDTEFLMNESLGVLEAMDEVLEIFAEFDPLDPDGNEMLRQPICPDGWEEPERQSEWLGSLGVVFQIMFDWDLSATVP